MEKVRFFCLDRRSAKAFTPEPAEKAEKNALLNTLYGNFLPCLIVIDGQEYEAVGIEVVIDRGGKKVRERYTFYKDGGEWKLYQIEQGAYIIVGM